MRNNFRFGVALATGLFVCFIMTDAAYVDRAYNSPYLPATGSTSYMIGMVLGLATWPAIISILIFIAIYYYKNPKKEYLNDEQK